MTIDLLIADDHEVVRAGLKTLLEGTDVRIVAEATGGDAALNWPRNTSPRWSCSTCGCPREMVSIAWPGSSSTCLRSRS